MAVKVSPLFNAGMRVILPQSRTMPTLNIPTAPNAALAATALCIPYRRLALISL
jgi:hypothetical protein